MKYNNNRHFKISEGAWYRTKRALEKMDDVVWRGISIKKMRLVTTTLNKLADPHRTFDIKKVYLSISRNPGEYQQFHAMNTGVEQPRVHELAKVMKHCGFLKEKWKGREVTYTIDPTALDEFNYKVKQLAGTF